MDNRSIRIGLRDGCRRASCLLSVLLALTVPRISLAQVEVIVGPDPTAGRELGLLGKSSVDPQRLGGQFAATALSMRPLFPDLSAEDLLGLSFVMSFPDSSSAVAALDVARSDSRVAFIQWNHSYHVDDWRPIVTAPLMHTDNWLSHRADLTDPLADSLDHFQVLNVASAWEVTRGAPSVSIGLVDTGIMIDHPDFVGQFRINVQEDINRNGRFDPGDLNGVDDDGNGYVDDVIGFDFVDRPQTVEPGDYHDRDGDPSDDGSGHGTSVAGVMSARDNNGLGIAGIAPGARLSVLRAFGADGRGDDDDISAAIVYAADEGIDVLNLSFGDSYYSPLMRESIRYAVARGVVVVASAGNVGGDSPHYPSDYDEVISTVWLDSAGGAPAGRATYGTGIDVGAPGTAVFTTLMPTDTPASGGLTPADSLLYGRQSGSSVAAPMVSATAALVRSLAPSASPATVRAAITTSAVDLLEPGWDHRTGAGLLNPLGALVATLPARIELSDPENDTGISNDTIVVVGSVIHPGLEGYSVSLAPGHEDLSDDDFEVVDTWERRQVLSDTLAAWSVTNLGEGPYTVRLSVQTTAGAVEVRRRVFIDRTPPVLKYEYVGAAIADGQRAVFVEVETDDLTRAILTIAGQDRPEMAQSARLSYRHGLTFEFEDSSSDSVEVALAVTNVAGLTTRQTEKILLVADHRGDLPVAIEPTGVAAGFLLPTLTDFDGDHLPEFVFNRYENGWIGDTLRIVEYGGGEYSVVSDALVGVFPRDIGDVNGNGREEILGQISAAALLLEQATEAGYPSQIILVDTTGISDPGSNDAVWASRLFDFNRDGKDEIVSHNTRSMRLLAASSNTLFELARFDNPTGTSGEISENSFQQPEMLVGDFDGDGQAEIVGGDSDGDWMSIEISEQFVTEPIWIHETNAYNAGSRMASGDFTGDGRTDLILSTTNWIGERADHVQEVPVTRLYLVSVVANNDYRLVDSLVVTGENFQHSSFAAADIDGDSVDELIVASAPDLLVLSYSDGWKLDYSTRGDPAAAGFGGARSAKIAVGDLDGDLRDDVLFGAADDRFYRMYAGTISDGQAPGWSDAYGVATNLVRLSWTRYGADSVSVYGAAPGGSFALDTTAVAGDTVVVATENPRRYFLRSWRSGVQGRASTTRLIVPHNPAVALSVEQIGLRSIAIRFDQEMRAGPDATVSLGSTEHDMTAADLITVSKGSTVVATFENPLAPGVLSWSGLRSSDGAPAVDGSSSFVPVEFDQAFILESWAVEGNANVRLRFSQQLDTSTASQASNYEILPAGTIRAVTVEDNGREVLLQISGIALGPTGLNPRLRVVGVRSSIGALIQEEGSVASLSESPTELTNAYVFPNPVEPGQTYLMIAGIPYGSSVDILSAAGARVRSLRETTGSGGVRWDLSDERGEQVPSGVYLVRVTIDGEESTLLKAAIIR
ncbi:MAG: S8 family serine peptidase [Rhodothermales bacterium]